ncbi:hypothetical protein [Nitrospira sp. Ecomares 2.1]
MQHPMKDHSGWKPSLLLFSCLSFAVCVAPVCAGEQNPVQTNNSQANKQSNDNQNQEGAQEKLNTLLPSHRMITGVVEGVAADQAKVNSGDSGEISPRYLSLERAKEKGFTLKQGDKLNIVVNARNHVVDYHLSKEKGQSYHRVIKGRLAQPLKVGQDHAVIKTGEGKEQSFPVRPLARSEVAAIPLDTDGLFLIDETNKIASATLTNDVIAEDDWARSTAYNVYRHIQGVVQNEPKNLSLTIQTKDKESLTLPVWDYLQENMITVLVDSDDKIVDIAHLPQSEK